MKTSIHLCSASKMFSQIIRKFYAFAPLLILVHLTLSKFHDYIRRFISCIVGKICTNTKCTAYLSAAIIIYSQSFLKVQSITENNSLGSGVYSQFLITGNKAVDKFKLWPESQRTPSNNLACYGRNSLGKNQKYKYLKAPYRGLRHKH